MTFPDKAFESIHTFASAYFDQLAIASQSVDNGALNEAALMLGKAYDRRAAVYVCGNGGSASISNHLVCDHLKGVQTDTNTRPRVISLSSNIEILTAIANDVSYEDIFTFQLSTMADAGDVLITISSSGDSENIVRAAQWAKSNECSVIAMTGFDGGRSSKLAHINLHVESDNYGVIEDTHQSLMHILAQFIRLDRMENTLISERRF
ncbi:MAG: phosphoheptose isomerase [Gammaproteobacteria bacterium]|nr:phosphoheptose isomerase [Gammaproteobacteria bacterium]